MAPPKGLQSFLNDMAALMRRKKEDMGRRSSLFEGVPPGNVGNVFDIAPSQLQFANTYTEEAYGVPVRVLDITGDDALGEMICISIAQERVVDDAESPTSSTTNDQIEGPLVGIVEFGAGAGIESFEFDIPVPRFTPGFINQRNPNIPNDVEQSSNLIVARRINGALLTLPASSLRVLVRNDANAPYLLRGRSSPASPTAAVSLNAYKAPAKVRVHATYGRRPQQAFLTRTIPICLGLSFDGTGGPTNALELGGEIRFNIPSYARSVRFPRYPINSTSLQIRLFQSQLKSNSVLSHTSMYTVPITSEGPIELSPLDTFIEIRNPGPDAIENLLAVFELAI